MALIEAGRTEMPNLALMNDAANDWRAPYIETINRRIEKWHTEVEERGEGSGFREIFRGLMHHVIHPTMIDLHKDIQYRITPHPKFGFPQHIKTGKWGRQKRGYKVGYYPQEHYEIFTGEHHGVYFMISVFGNYELQRICIDVTYYKSIYDREQRGTFPKELKVSSQEFQPQEIIPELFKSLVNKGIYQARMVGKEFASGAAK